MELLVTYDVDTTTPAGRARLRQVAKICEAYGQRVQKSVFEVVLAPAQGVALQADLERVLTEMDNLRVYHLPQGTLANTVSLRTCQHIPEGQAWVV